MGYVEIIEMGQLDADSAPIIDTEGLADASRVAINAAAAITHGGDGVPVNCSILVDAWSPTPAWMVYGLRSRRQPTLPANLSFSLIGGWWSLRVRYGYQRS